MRKRRRRKKKKKKQKEKKKKKKKKGGEKRKRGVTARKNDLSLRTALSKIIELRCSWTAELPPDRSTVPHHRLLTFIWPVSELLDFVQQRKRGH